MIRNPFARLSAAALTVLVAAQLAVPTARAAEPAPLRSLEDAIESRTDAVLLPSTAQGTLTFKECQEPCTRRTLRLDAQSKLYVGATEVTLAQFNAYVQRTGPQFLMVFHQPGQLTITRLMVFGKLQ